ncbi:hypothetical protein JOD03_002552 [Chryseomicrobium aureum]|uniref:hypothetical protein n=1 Tax=Chryseomicrobium aureum TaxID=1441723 RepID=UPI00195EB71B|nr:hypothetical protein [Chryseomicrobium aureum]MBM7707605.1 hypothetical protein [Chryseomicrobium aureum]
MENIRSFRVYVHREDDGTKALTITEKNKYNDDFRHKSIYIGEASQRDAVSCARSIIVGELKDDEIAVVRTNLLCPPNKAYSTDRFKIKRGKFHNRTIIELAEKAYKEQLETDWTQFAAVKKPNQKAENEPQPQKKAQKTPSQPKEKRGNGDETSFRLSEILSEQDRRKLYGIK